MLKGTLDHFALADIFRLLSWAKKTGKLEVVRSAGRGKIFFRSGEVYYAESSLTREPLGQKLIRAGALTDGQLMKALDQNAQTGERVGQILVSNGWVTDEQLQGSLRQQIEDAVFDLLRWELGEFEFSPAVEADIEVQISVSVENLIIEASRRLDELEVIERKIPSEHAVLKMSNKPPEGAAEINITPEEWRMLVLVDGSRTVHEIAQLVGIDDFGALRALYGLVSAGLVEVVDRDTAPAGGGEAVAPFDHATPPTPPAELIPATEDVAAEMPPVDAGALQPVEHHVSTPEPDPEPLGGFAELGSTEADGETEAEGEAGEPEAVAEPAPVPEQVLPEPIIPAATTAFEPSMKAPPLGDAPSESAFVSQATGGWDAETMSSVFKVEEPDTQATGQNGTTVFEPSGQPVPEPAQGAPEPGPDPADEAVVPAVEQFDAPRPGEMDESKPDPFLNDLLGDQGVMPVQQQEPMSAQPQPPAPNHPQVDRTTVVRELAGLFSDDERPPARQQESSEENAERPAGGAAGDQRKRIEDDDQLNKGLISRLIDGVKGL